MTIGRLLRRSRASLHRLHNAARQLARPLGENCDADECCYTGNHSQCVNPNNVARHTQHDMRQISDHEGDEGCAEKCGSVRGKYFIEIKYASMGCQDFTRNNLGQGLCEHFRSMKAPTHQGGWTAVMGVRRRVARCVRRIEQIQKRFREIYVLAKD
jgi:hypothetical protein